MCDMINKKYINIKHIKLYNLIFVINIFFNYTFFSFLLCYISLDYVIENDVSFIYFVCY